jgi:hypothetical protein
MSEKGKHPSTPVDGKRKQDPGKKKRGYNDPPLPKSVPSRKPQTNQQKEWPSKAR